jgi:hypothetical protein
VVPFPQGARSTSKQLGQIPASYSAGSGTIVGGETADKATEAALAAYPGGIVDRVVKLSNGDHRRQVIRVTASLVLVSANKPGTQRGAVVEQCGRNHRNSWQTSASKPAQVLAELERRVGAPVRTSLEQKDRARCGFCKSRGHHTARGGAANNDDVEHARCSS